MLILAFDTSGFACSVALLDGLNLLGEAVLDSHRRSAQTLAPAIDSLLRAGKVQPRQIGLVATTIGPGSFTGLRVGVTTAKTFAYAAEAAVIGISTLESLASGVPPELLAQSREIYSVLDAQRRELFVGHFRCDAPPGDAADLPTLTRLAPDRIVSTAEWPGGLRGNPVVTGPGLGRVETQLPPGVTVVGPGHREPRASIVGRLAWRDYQSGRRDDLWKLAPVYLRPSYAEEKSLTSPR